MNTYKNENGITLVALALTVLIMAILAGVAIYEGKIGTETAKNSKLMSEVGMVQHAVLEQYTKYKTTKNEAYLIGSKMNKSDVTKIAAEMGINLVNIPSNYNKADYYRLSASDVSKLGFQNVSDEFIVNYVSGEVINYTKRKDSKGNPIYVKADTFTTQVVD